MNNYQITIIVPSLSIPDTIIFKYDEPIFWYFMNGNMIKKRNKEKLNNKSIERSFLKRVPECGVVAQYFYKVDDGEKEAAKEVIPKENENTKVIFEYFNVEEFSKTDNFYLIYILTGNSF